MSESAVLSAPERSRLLVELDELPTAERRRIQAATRSGKPLCTREEQQLQYAFLAKGRGARLFNAIWIPLMLAFFGTTSLSNGHQWWRWLLLVLVALSAVQAIVLFVRMRGLERKLGLTKAHFA